MAIGKKRGEEEGKEEGRRKKKKEGREERRKEQERKEKNEHWQLRGSGAYFRWGIRAAPEMGLCRQKALGCVRRRAEQGVLAHRVITHHPTPRLSRQYLQRIKLGPREEVLLAQGQKEGLLLLASVFAPPQAPVRQGYEWGSRPRRGATVHPADLNTPSMSLNSLLGWKNGGELELGKGEGRAIGR